jgi:hypothetical protein
METNGTGTAAAAAASALEDSALWKAVTVCAVNKYRGLVRVTHDAGDGAIYFEDGRIVHAEAGHLRGEPAFRAIMRWPGSDYALEPDAQAGQASITRGVALLLLDLKGPAPSPSTPPAGSQLPSPARPAAAGVTGSLDRLAAVTERIRRLPGVLGATFTSQDGAAGRSGLPALDAEALAIAPPARRLGAALGLGRLVLGVARGTERLVLLIAARDHQITVVLRADDQVEAVQAQIRGLLKAEA